MDDIDRKNVPFISLIQFPFRFFVPFTLLLLLYLALSLNQWSEQKWFRLLGILGILIFSAQTIQNLYQHLEKWENETFVSRHTYLFDTPEEARKTFFSKDMSTSLFVFQKPPLTISQSIRRQKTTNTTDITKKY